MFTPANNVGLARVPADGGELEWLTTPSRERREKTHRFPDVLPGSKAALFTLGSGDIESFDDASVAVVSLDTGAYRILVEGGMNPRYSSTGHVLYAHGDDVFAVAFDVETLELTGIPAPVLGNVSSSPGGGAAELCVSRDGSLVYVSGGSRSLERNIVVWRDREGETTPLIDTPNSYAHPRLSPDGRLLTMWIDSANTGIWVYDIGRASLSRLAFGYDHITPEWTPDGQRIAFSASTEGFYNIYWQTADGSMPAERLVQAKGFANTKSFSRDGAYLAYDDAVRGEDADIWLVPLDGGGEPQLILQSPAQEIQPAISPDGHWLAYRSNESGRNEVYVTSFPEPRLKLQVSTEGGGQPRWTRDGRELVYSSGSAIMSVTVAPADDGLTLSKPQSLFEHTGGYDVTSDGNQFITLVSTPSAAPVVTQLNLILNWSDELERTALRD